MFDRWKRHFSSEQSEEQGDTSALTLPAPTGNTIIFLYDEVDSELWYDLAAHINTLMLRFPDIYEWKYYLYPIPGTRSENKHEAFVSDLEKALVFLPCTSATFLTRFFQAIQKDTRLTPLLAQTYVQPIPLRAAHGVKQSTLAKPLAAYPAGHERDEACIQVVAMLEQKLMSYRGSQGNVQAPLALLAETTSRLVVPATV